MEEEKRYFYQPNMTTTIIEWCWTFMILIVGIIIWLEITHFQWISACFIAAFLILAFLGVSRRTVMITPTKMVYSRVLQKDFLTIPLKDVRQPVFTKHTLTMTVNGEVLTFTFRQAAIKDIQRIFKIAQVGH
ncbi:EbsA family protein [Limosilactobacillus difficilis]|uniref:EbsA family protein n=1 Tax=Limosilactobacillus difficilis TaxID=2991838 RepID=UPI0024BBD19F|nr:EbsA family protein [Limosilactobacillus difficilis]